MISYSQESWLAVVAICFCLICFIVPRRTVFPIQSACLRTGSYGPFILALLLEQKEMYSLLFQQTRARASQSSYPIGKLMQQEGKGIHEYMLLHSILYTSLIQWNVNRGNWRRAEFLLGQVPPWTQGGETSSSSGLLFSIPLHPPSPQSLPSLRVPWPFRGNFVENLGIGMLLCRAHFV